MLVDKQKEALRLMEENNYEQAAKLLIESIDEQPDDPIRYINLASLLVQMKQYEEAERFLLKAIELDDKTATAYYGLGNLYYEKELFEEAEKMFQHAVRLGLHDSDVYYILGMTYVKQNNNLLALPYLQRATELENDVQKLFQYGLVLAQTNYLEEAETILLQVIKKDKNNADALYNLGIIAAHHQKYAEAQALINQVLTAQPDHLLAVKAKEDIEAILANER